MDAGIIFILILIASIILLMLIYQSENKKLKRVTIISFIGLFCWSLSDKSTVDNAYFNGFLVFLLISGFIFFIWTKIDNEKLEEKRNEDKKEKDFNNFIYSLKAYGTYLQLNPLPVEVIRNSNTLPFNKTLLMVNAILYINVLNKDIQEVLLVSIPELSFYKDDVPDNGYQTELSKSLENDEFSNLENNLKNEMNKKEFNKEKIGELLETTIINLNKNNDFPYELYSECEKESDKIYKALKNAIKNY